MSMYTMYKQTDGIVMGSLLGPVLANIFVGYHEARFSTRLPSPACIKVC